MGRMKADQGYDYLKEFVKLYDNGADIEFKGDDFIEAARAVMAENCYLRRKMELKRNKVDYEKDDIYFNKLAKGLVCQIFRNSILEDFHSEGIPIGDSRMKELMKDCVNRAFPVVAALCSDNAVDKEMAQVGLIGIADDYCKQWDDAETTYMQYIDFDRRRDDN